MSEPDITILCQSCKREYQANLDKLRQEETIYKTVYRGQQEEWRIKCPHCGHYNVVTIERRPGRGG